MISKEEFCNFINNYKTFNEGVERMGKAITGNEYSCNIFESDWCDAFENMAILYMKKVFTKDGEDLIFWWMFEDVDKVISYNMADLFSSGTEIVFDVEDVDSLWDYIMKFKDDYLKNVV